MKIASSSFIVVIGLVLLWLVVSGKIDNVTNAWAVLTNKITGADAVNAATNAASNLTPATATVQTIGLPATTGVTQNVPVLVAM